MRPILALIAGDPVRVSTSAAAIVAVGAILGGHGMPLLAALWTLTVASAAFLVAFMILAIAASMAGAIEPPPAAAAEPKGGGDA